VCQQGRARQRQTNTEGKTIKKIVNTTPPKANGADAMVVALSFLETTSDSETRNGAVVIEHPPAIVHTSAILHPSAFNACAHLDQ